MEKIKNFFNQTFARIALCMLFVVASVTVLVAPARTMKSMRTALKEW